MSGYLLRRVPSALLVLLLASVLVFLVIRLIPGDPAAVLAGSDATPEAVAAIRRELGLDQPLHLQYLHWLGGLLAGDLGSSYLIGGEIGDLLADGAANTVVLATTALVLAVLCAAVLGPLWAVTRSRWVDRALTGFTTAAVALPPYVTGVLLVLVFGVAFRLLPAGGVPPDGLADRLGITAQYLVLPASCLALPVAAVLTRFFSEALRGELARDYATTAAAAGIPRCRIVFRHALRNAVPAAVTVLGLQIGNLLGGAVLVEAVFSWPGLGMLVEQGIDRRDYPVVQVLLVLSVAVYVVIQLVTDVVHAYLDPRIRLGGTS
ncbi:ABC transporter permease [Saccharopolyspora hirsuta]|uniref:ABC transporter permease n=1 Tax=Saccharopolyspora hirsuta TaxID=1837 RepID=A0A5M7BWD2_SACHI|nr:ABC transporter permease [Saccharopolyspora hirsuta]KAA5834546.1 ABC transporter permease [Saccharopolyspora hirsuta]